MPHEPVQERSSHTILFDQLDEELILKVALKTGGSAGRSGLDDSACGKRLCTPFGHD